MWWPQIEFVNTAEPIITNQLLEIFPSGHVKHTVTYGVVALLVLASAVERRLRGTPARRRRVNRVAAVILPLAYLAVVAASTLL